MAPFTSESKVFNKLRDMAAAAANKGGSLFNRTINKALFVNVVSAGFLIASADDDFDADEKKALVRLINKDLPDFTTEDIIKVIDNCASKMEFDKDLGIQEILNEISKTSGNEDDAKQIMAVCAFIGAADGEYDQQEKLVARSICYALKLNPTHYKL